MWAAYWYRDVLATRGCCVGAAITRTVGFCQFGRPRGLQARGSGSRARGLGAGPVQEIAGEVGFDAKGSVWMDGVIDSAEYRMVSRRVLRGQAGEIKQADRTGVAGWTGRGSGLGFALVLGLFATAGTSVLGQLPPTPKQHDRSARAQPKLFVANRILDLGKVIEGDKVIVRWILENQGDADLVIEETHAACGCTVIDLPEDQRVIAPGSLIELAAQFDSSKRRGSQRKHITVKSNDPTEESLRLEFTAEVQGLLDVKPSQSVNVRMLQRGQTADRYLELTPSPGRGGLEILGVGLPENAPMTAEVQPFQDGSKTGQRVYFTVSEAAPLGRVNMAVVVHVNVDGFERTHTTAVRGEVVADLLWQPALVDLTRMKTSRGRHLTPVVVRASAKTPFEVLSASAGPLLDVAFKPVGRSAPYSRYEFTMTVRDDAPSGPFATTLNVYTSSLDQPVLFIPVFGHVAPRVLVEPALVVLRQDGTLIGTRRRVKLQASPQAHLKLTKAECELDSIRVGMDYEASSPYKHLRFLEVALVEDLPPGTHETTVVVTTSIVGAETIEIPVRIDVPDEKIEDCRLQIED